MGDFGACDANTALQAVYTAEKVAEQARDFMYKPDGGTQPVLSRASLRSNPFLRADVGYKMGLVLDQEPTVYTAGTEYLMPGPAGNLFKVPNDPTIRKVLVDQARKALAVFQSVNWPVPPPEMLVRSRRRLRLAVTRNSPRRHRLRTCAKKRRARLLHRPRPFAQRPRCLRTTMRCVAVARLRHLLILFSPSPRGRMTRTRSRRRLPPRRAALGAWRHSR